MLRSFTLILLSLLTLMGWAQRRVTIVNYDVKGFSKSDTLVYRWGIIDGVHKPVTTERSALVQRADTFVLGEPRILIISLKGKQGMMEVLLQPGECVTLRGKLRSQYSKNHHSAVFQGLTVDGASAQEEYHTMITSVMRYRDSLSRVPADYAEISSRYDEAMALGDNSVIAALQRGSYEEQNYLQMVNSRDTEVHAYIHDMVDSYRDSFMGPLLMLRLYGVLDDRFRTMFNSLDGKAKNSYYGRMVRKMVFTHVRNGQIAKPLSVQDTLMQEHTLDFRDKVARYTLVDFWAAYCAPCRKELPALIQTYERYKSKGLNVITISLDPETDEWLHALRGYRFPWQGNYFDTNHVSPRQFGFEYIPFNVIVDYNGLIVAQNLHGIELSDFLDMLLSDE